MSDRSAWGRRAALQTGAALAASGASLLWPAAPALAEAPARRAQPQEQPAALPSLALIALTRLAFGPRPGQFDFDTFAARPGATDADKLYDFIDWQLNPNFGDDPDYLARRTAAGFATLGKSLPQLWQDHVRNATGTNANNIRLQPVRETRADTLLRAVYSRWQLVEVLVHFWHNHFSVYGWDSAIAPVFVHYDRDVIRANALGNFRTFIEAVAKSTAMLFYLDNATSQGAQFNENFARELCELHTLGAENYLGVGNPMAVNQIPAPHDGQPINEGYVDNDVYEVARCLTGWRVNDGTGGAPGNDG
ncbi:MAG: DUF1800 family protein, partial [Anaerolineales bacterium]|nr:DUF1800 family protein [Anaerolineales bacterium]